MSCFDTGALVNGFQKEMKKPMSHFLCLSVSEFSSMEGVPLKMPEGLSQEVKDDVTMIVPDYLTILQETEVSMFLLYLYVKQIPVFVGAMPLV